MGPYVFPRWTNALLPSLVAAALLVPPYVAGLVAYGFSPETTDVGYMPEQPVPFSHAKHAGELGMDCRYCHNTVEYAAKAAIPPTQTCLNCHGQIHKDSVKLAAMRHSASTGESILWRRIHDLPDYAYFSHAAHVNRGVSCVSCHGRIDRMEVVYQHEPLSMGWCLDCHRDPVEHIRDPKLVTDLDWTFDEDVLAKKLFKSEEKYHEFWMDHNKLNPSQDCSTCHR